MPPRRFFVYYLTLSIGCVGAFSLWAHAPHALAASRAHTPPAAYSTLVIDARRLPPIPVRTSIFLSDSKGAFVYAHTEGAISQKAPLVRRLHRLEDAFHLPNAPNLLSRVTVYPMSWNRDRGYILDAKDAAQVANLQGNGLIGNGEQILILTNDGAAAAALQRK